MTTNEKDPKEHFVQPLRTPKTRNGNTTTILVVYELTAGARFVHACEVSGSPAASLAAWAGGEAGWASRLGETFEVPAKVAKDYLERARRLALKAIDEATKSVTFTRDCRTILPPDNGKDGIAQAEIAFERGERVDVTDLVLPGPGGASPGIATFRYRGWRRWVPADAFMVTP